jgi:hypothetical protein
MSFPSKYKHPNMHKPLLLKFWNGFDRYLLQIHCTVLEYSRTTSAQQALLLLPGRRRDAGSNNIHAVPVIAVGGRHCPRVPHRRVCAAAAVVLVSGVRRGEVQPAARTRWRLLCRGRCEGHCAGQVRGVGVPVLALRRHHLSGAVHGVGVGRRRPACAESGAVVTVVGVLNCWIWVQLWPSSVRVDSAETAGERILVVPERRSKGLRVRRAQSQLRLFLLHVQLSAQDPHVVRQLVHGLALLLQLLLRLGLVSPLQLQVRGQFVDLLALSTVEVRVRSGNTAILINETTVPWIQPAS